MIINSELFEKRNIHRLASVYNLLQLQTSDLVDKGGRSCLYTTTTDSLLNIINNDDILYLS